MAPKLPRSHRVKKEGSQYRVVGVPIFAEHSRTFSCPKTGKQYTVHVDRKRLEKFASNGNKRASQDDYLAAVHPVHNGEEGASSPSCGLIDNYRVQTFEFEGKPQAVLTVDLIARDRAELETIKRHPYRSPETNLQKNEIGTLALLERQAPFFKFPLFKTEDESAIYRAENTNQPEAAGVAFAAYQDATQYAPLYRWNLNYREAGVKSEDKPKGDKASCKAAKPKGKDEPDVLKRLESLEGYMKKFVSYLEDDEGDEEDAKKKQKSEEPAALLSQEQLKAYEDDRALLIATAERCDALYSEVYSLRGQLAGIKSENESLKARNEATDLINWAMAETESLVRPANFTDEVQALYSEEGAAAARAYVRGLTLGGVEREDYRAEGDDSVTRETFPACVEKYRDNPVDFERAKTAYQQYQAGGAVAKRHFGSVEKFIETEFAGYRN